MSPITVRDALSTILFGIFGIALFAFAVIAVVGACTDDRYEPLEGFKPIIDGEAHVGEQLTVRNGICNRKSKPLSVKLHAYLQRQETSTAIGGFVVTHTYDVRGSAKEPLTMTLFVCIGTEPTRSLRVPSNAIPGTYTLTVVATTVSEFGEEQRVVVASDPFTVAAAR